MCCILATSPLLLNEDIVVGYERLIHSDFSSIVPVVQFSYPILRSYGMNSEGEIYFNWPEYAKTRSQDLESAYHDSGTFYWHKIDRIGYGGYLKLACRFPEFVDYVESVCREFRELYDNIRGITYLPRQAGQVAKLLKQIQQEYHRYNNVEGLLSQLQALLADMQTQDLPRSREEFEARAVLFYILKQLEELLEVKKRFCA